MRSMTAFIFDQFIAFYCQSPNEWKRFNQLQMNKQSLLRPLLCSKMIYVNVLFFANDTFVAPMIIKQICLHFQYDTISIFGLIFKNHHGYFLK